MSQDRRAIPISISSRCLQADGQTICATHRSRNIPIDDTILVTATGPRVEPSIRTRQEQDDRGHPARFGRTVSQYCLVGSGVNCWRVCRTMTASGRDAGANCREFLRNSVRFYKFRRCIDRPDFATLRSGPNQLGSDSYDGRAHAPCRSNRLSRCDAADRLQLRGPRAFASGAPVRQGSRKTSVVPSRRGRAFQIAHSGASPDGGCVCGWRVGGH